MANLNKVMLIGRLTRDPETRTFSTGGKVAKFGFAVNNRRKNASTVEWEDEPVFVDVEAFNRGEAGRQLADQVEQYMRKGHQVFIEGHLRLDQWTSQDGQKRQALKIVLDNYQLLEPRTEGGSGPRTAPAARKPVSPTPDEGSYVAPTPELPDPSPGPGDETIPF